MQQKINSNRLTLSGSLQAGWVILALLALLLLRLGAMAASGSGLHVDEAQYWVWSQDLQWGYYSKPPVIAALIRLSTALFGDSVAGIRLVCMVCWLAASGVLVWLGTRMHSIRAGLWAGALLAATPASGLLGLVATTDAPLVLGWSVCMALVWQAGRAATGTACGAVWPCGRALAWWAAAGLALGLTLLSKYTALALLPSLVWVALWGMRCDPALADRPLQPGATPARYRFFSAGFWGRAGPGHSLLVRLAGPALALLVALLCLLPHLAWNARYHWPTLQHTLDITVRASAAKPWSLTGGLAALGEHLAGQLVLTGPALWLVLWGVWAGWRKSQAPDAQSGARAAMGWALAFAIPLQLLGLVQAIKGGAQLNWTAPSLAGLCLAGGLWLATCRLYERRALLALLLSLGLCAWVGSSRDLRLWHTAPDSKPLDFWHKTRLWPEALQSLDAARQAHPTLVVATVQRDMLVFAAYYWRTEPPPLLQSWREGGPIRHHFDLVRPLDVRQHEALLFLDDSPPPAALRATFGSVELLARTRQGRLAPGLWLLRREPASALIKDAQ